MRLLLLGCFFYTLNASADFKPEKGFVPNEQVAIKIAEAVLVPIYGKGVLKEKPWKVVENNGKWQLDGSLPKPKEGIALGGTAHIEIDRATGMISNVSHGK